MFPPMLSSTSLHATVIARQLPSPQSGGGGTQQAFSLATSVTSRVVGIFQRASQNPSSMITVPCSGQSCVTRKMISGAQSHQGNHGHQGHIRSRSSSGAGDKRFNSRSRKAGSVAVSTAAVDVRMSPPSSASSALKTLRSGLGPGAGNLANAGSPRITGVMRSTKAGSSCQKRYFNHHQGHQPQHQRNLISNAPVASVVSQPTNCLLSHHHHQSTS